MQANIRANIMSPGELFLGTDMALSTVLLRGSRSPSQSPEEVRRRVATIGIAHRLGIMLPSCTEEPPDAMSLRMLKTPEQVTARDDYVSLLGTQENADPPSLADQHALSIRLSAIIGFEDPEMQSINHHLTGISIKRAGRASDDPWKEEDWDMELIASDNPLKVSSIFTRLSRMTHNTVCLDPVSGDSRGPEGSAHLVAAGKQVRPG